MSADKQAVREMNQALANWDAEHGYASIPDVDTCMQVLANLGYNTDNWTCLTDGYQVYWYQTDNRMILYNASTASIEYPEEYVGTKTMVTSENKFFIYNENHVKAQQFDMDLSSSFSSSDKITGSSSLTSATSVTSSSITSGANTHQTENLSTLSSAITSNTSSAVSKAIQSAAGVTSASDIKYYATREVVSSQTANVFVSLQVSSVGKETVLTSVGDMKENLYYLEIVAEEGASETEIKAAQVTAGQYIYNIFDQMTTGKVVSNAAIVLAPNTTIDCSTCEWAPCKTFCGYFGTTDDDNPIVISGARLTAATGHASTVAFNGSSSKYFVTGFFGTIYGDTTIENVTFKDLTITNPASDYELTTADIDGKLTATRNTVGIIGGITDNYCESNAAGTKANVTLRNIIVESSCNIEGTGCAGGLVGYIGSTKSKDLNLNGTITLDNCQIHTNVTSNDNVSGGGYRAIGGVFGFCCRVDNGLTININNTTFDGTLNGYGYIGAIAGAAQNSYIINVNGGNYASAKLATDSTKTPWKTASGFGYINDGTITINGASLISGIAVAHNANATNIDGKANVDYVLNGTTLKKQ